MLIRWKAAAVAKEEGARGKHTQTHPHRPPDTTHTHIRAADGTPMPPKERAHLFFERISGNKNAAESIMRNYTGTPMCHTNSRKIHVHGQGEYVRNFCNYYKLISIFRKRAIIRSLIIYLKEAE